MTPYTSDRAVKLFGKIGLPRDDYYTRAIETTIHTAIGRSYLIDKLVAAGCHISIYPDETAISDAYADRVADNANLDLALIEAAEKVLSPGGAQ